MPGNNNAIAASNRARWVESIKTVSGSIGCRDDRIRLGLSTFGLCHCPIDERWAHPVIRISSQAISTYMTMPSTARARRTANTSGMLNWD